MPDDAAFKTSILLLQVPANLMAATAALELFNAAYVEMDFISRRHRIIDDLAAAMQAELPADMDPVDGFAAGRSMENRATEIVDKAHQPAVNMPEFLIKTLPRLHARSFLYELDGISKVLGVLAKSEGCPTTLKDINDSWSETFPGMKDLRDSAHHAEDRLRRINKKGKPLVPYAIDSSVIQAPDGSAIFSDFLNDRTYTATADNGALVGLEVCENTLSAAAHHIQMALDAFSWRGPERYEPF